MLTRVWMIAWKEFLQIMRDWRTLAVVLILPVVMLILYGYAINFDLKHLRLGIQDDDRSVSSRQLIDAFAASVYFDVRTRIAGPREATAALDGGVVKAVLVIPRGFAADLAADRTPPVALLVDGSDSTSANSGLAYAGAVIQEYSSRVVMEALGRRGVGEVDAFVPVEVRPRFWYNPDQKSTNYIVPGLLAVIMMMLSSLLTAMTVVRERERGTVEQLIVTPLKAHELLLGKLAPYVIIAYVDVILIITAGRLLFGIPVLGSKALLLLMTGVFLSASLGIGMLISVVSPTQQTAMTIAMLASQLPSILLSGFVFPISAMPRIVQWLTAIIPARHFLVIVRSIFLKGVGLEVFLAHALVLLAFGGAVMGIGALSFRKKL